MPVIHRNVTRTILDTTETTLETRTPTGNALAFVLTSASKFYLGFKKPFTTRYFHFSTDNATQRTITVKYWNGTAFTAVEDFVDQTLGFTQSGFISWQNVGDWREKAQTPVIDVDLFWVEITVDDALDNGTALQSLLNLFSDDGLVEGYYPDLISDTRYLPEGKTDYIQQHLAAKDLVVLRLKQDKIINDESRIIDINEVAVATVHAFVWILVNPIARDEGEINFAKEAFKNFNRELNKVPHDFDHDDSGIVETDEEGLGSVVIKRI